VVGRREGSAHSRGRLSGEGVDGVLEDLCRWTAQEMACQRITTTIPLHADLRFSDQDNVWPGLAHSQKGQRFESHGSTTLDALTLSAAATGLDP
jgi:hypothetical protein